MGRTCGECVESRLFVVDEVVNHYAKACCFRSLVAPLAVSLGRALVCAVQKQQSPRIATRALFSMVRHQTNGMFLRGLGFSGVWGSLENSEYPN